MMIEPDRLRQIDNSPWEATTEEIRDLIANQRRLHDDFAMSIDADEVSDLRFRTISRRLGEEMVGRECPSANDVDGQRAKLAWDLELNATLRYMLADAMMKARG